MPDDDFLERWCDRHLGARPARVLFRSGHLSEVIGTELADGRQVVVKIRPAEARIAGCIAVQRHLAQSADFIARYQQAAGRRWSDREVQNAWAAGLWVRLLDAKMEAAEGGGPQLDRLARELPDRLTLGQIKPVLSNGP